MKRFIRLFSLAASAGVAFAIEVTPLEIHQTDTTYNFISQRGVPISATAGTPPGSDGRMTTTNETAGSVNPPTAKQFRGLVSFGAIPSPTNKTTVASSSILQGGTTAFSTTVAQQMQRPMGVTADGVIIMRRAVVGAPYLSRQISFLFGSVISVPDVDENGLLLTNVVKETYWLPEPFTTNGHTNAPYYWSPNARKVYAIQPGPISVRWKKAASTTTQPPDYTANPTNYFVDGGNYFRLYSANYIVSGSAIKPPRKIYWTEKSFQNLSKLVTVPPARVGAVTIAYNRNFPRTVTNEFIAPGQTSFTDGSTNSTLQELRTLWFDQIQGNIHAYNQEGRVFLELLGDSRSDGLSRVQLGFEIVDVYKQINPVDVATELGERLPPAPPGSITALSPEPVLQVGAPEFAFAHNINGSSQVEYFATRETRNLNDYMVHWMETGEVGLLWPAQLARYKLSWPTDPSKYSHYIRPLVATENEAKETAVPIPSVNVPVIEYQDPFDGPRAKLTDDFKFYTFLDANVPAHRTLLRFASGENISFERVFSWLDVNLKSGTFVSTVATNLDGWNSTNNTLAFQSLLTSPRVVNQTVNVGDRIGAPSGEIGYAGDYLAGYIKQSAGNSFNPGSYIDPFVEGFDAADLGSIIPVNAIPGKNTLEVWWFRRNAADSAKGFESIYWPSTIGRYTIQWPASPLEIVLASNKGSAGSGVNDPLVALGTIYAQNDATLPGDNPNEEHAIMSGGTAFALRDDLNNTNAATYSSHPFVLVDYKAADNRPSMAIYKVLREKPSDGILFDYIVKAGTLLQAPMPLPLMQPPVDVIGGALVNYNAESSTGGQGDLPGNWDDTRDLNSSYFRYNRFTYRDRKQGFWVYRGLHAGLPTLQAGQYDATNRVFNSLPEAFAVVGQPFSYTIHASRQDQFLNLIVDTNSFPAWLQISGLTLRGTPTGADVGSNTVQIVVSDFYLGDRVTNSLPLTVAATGPVVAQVPATIVSSNQYTGVTIAFTNRPPFLAHSPMPTNSFTMRFYYKTQPTFAWPGVANPPAVGTIVPYLRPMASDGSFTGDAADKGTASLDIVYRPVWPVLDPSDKSKLVPTMPYGQTLTKPINGLPGVRDFRTAEVLYQQSIAQNITNAVATVVLIDPTREKSSDFQDHSLGKIPGGIRTDFYQGKYYFPDLPPHLSTRIFVDPSRGPKGALIFRGEFKDEIAGEKYVLLNSLTTAELAQLKGICPSGDPDRSSWENVVNSLATKVETFYQAPNSFNWTPNPGATYSVAVTNLAVIQSPETAVDSYALSATGPGTGYITLVESGGSAFTQPGDPVALHILRVGGSLYTGELKVIPSSNPLSEQVTLQHTGDFAGRSGDYEYQWKIASPVDGLPPLADDTMSRYLALTSGSDITRYVLGGAGVRALSDNYLVMRYRPTNPGHPLYKTNATDADWSSWTRPVLAEGWIKRVLAGINPFNQRTADLFSNRVNTDSSIIAQAGHRWEGDVALNQSTLNNYGLIEIYETVLRRGRSLSIESGFNYGPANDALLLAAGYLNDLYMMLGNEAWADAANPTIGIGTKDKTYGDIATALFAFKGQQASLLDEELALLRGRDDFLLPSVEVPPFYNRLVWNYTRGIDAGEVIYALNYNILDQNGDGIIDASDAAALYPQAHGDAYGHYLTALKGYYSLLINPSFDWAPRIEAVSILGQSVSVDYLDERKFAAAAAAVARAGNQVLDLTWRHDYQPTRTGWSWMTTNRVNSQRQFQTDTGDTVSSTRYWGVDHWATRAGQGAYLNWIVGNAILPAVDPNPSHEGIQKIDRTTVPELQELVTTAQALETSLEDAEGSLTPVGLPPGSVALDINPNQIGADNGTHFEQIYTRAKGALNNAVAAFDDAKDVTRLMRSEQDSLADFKAGVDKQELAYTNSLVELYGTAYAEDIGPGKLYPQGYAGPDLFHFAYIDSSEITVTNSMMPDAPMTYKLDVQQYATNYNASDMRRFDFIVKALNSNPDYQSNVHYISITVDSYGNYKKPTNWVSHRSSPGKIQESLSHVLQARNALLAALDNHQSLKRNLDVNMNYFQAKLDYDFEVHQWDHLVAITQTTLESGAYALKMGALAYGQTMWALQGAATTASEAIPKVTIAGTAVGGDMLSSARASVLASLAVAQQAAGGANIVKEAVVGAITVAKEGFMRQRQADVIGPDGRELENKRQVADLDKLLGDVQSSVFLVNQRLQELSDALRATEALVAQGERLQQERLVFRQRSAAVIQGFRTRDAAFRLFRNEKLERYKTLFDLASKYAFLSANAYDYETGLLNTTAGQAFIARILNSRALGVVRNGEPQYAGSDTGDPGLSSALAEMKADWDVLRGRLGFNNPDAYGTTVSLRTEKFRVLPGTAGSANWQDVLRGARVDNLLADSDVKRYCMQIERGNNLPVPGFVIEFSTTIENGLNLFGLQTAAGDHSYSPSSFATKIFGVGVAFEGYRGMDNPTIINGVITGTGGTSPSDPSLDPLALSATPYIYLIPVGVDAMRSPPLGDQSEIRTWNVEDVAVPLPFNIGASGFSSNPAYQSNQSLTEPLFTVRKHQAFRPVSTTAVFSPSLYGPTGTLQRSQFTNNRLVGRSVWNTHWKLVIPADTLLNDSAAGIDRFLQTVTDIKLHFVTYSYSGN